MIALVGGVRTDVALNYIEFMVDETYTNRLRWAGIAYNVDNR